MVWKYATPGSPLQYQICDLLSLNEKVNVRKNPGINQNIIDKISPGEVVRLYDYECADGYVFWQIEKEKMDNSGFFVGLLFGWIAEANNEDIIIQPCLGNPICEQ